VIINNDSPSLAANANPYVFGAAASGHGKYKKTTNPQMRDGNHLQVEYYATFPTNHELQFKTSPGRDLQMIDWNSLPQAAKDALNTHDFGAATVPFKDAKNTFTSNLDKAWIDGALPPRPSGTTTVWRGNRRATDLPERK
jgi:hypothetical protein